MTVALFPAVRAFAAERLDMTVLLDLSKSEAAKDQANKEEFRKNIDGVTRVLASLPAGARVAVYGITSDSFGKPYPLLAGRLTDDEGYFKERLARARAQLIRTCQERSQKLQPESPHTDLLGAFLVASEQFASAQEDRRKVLIIFSDMRQSTRVLDLERPALVQETKALQQVAKSQLIPDLRGVDVYVLGVDGTRKSVNYWQTLRDFWMGYFALTEATVNTYSTLRPIPR
jgi:hypothetical protein